MPETVLAKMVDQGPKADSSDWGRTPTSGGPKVACEVERWRVHVRALGHALRTEGDVQLWKGDVFACVPQGTHPYFDFLTNVHIPLKACVP